MENTEKVLFEDDSPQWYVAQGESVVGPVPASEIYERIVAQQLSWLNWVWRSGQKDWKRIADLEIFQIVAPPTPKVSLLKELIAHLEKPARTKQAPPEAPTGRDWFLYYNDSQFGPFGQDEIDRALKAGKIHGRVYAWKDGMETWVKLEQIDLFEDAIEESEKAWQKRRASKVAAKETPASAAKEKDERQDQRRGPRRPLVARIMLAPKTGAESVTVAVCRDISVGGMQVLTDRIPGEVGNRIKLNVSPSSAAREGQIEPFVAEGVIVRILEDRRGFSFRFEKLSDQARRAIESYIQ